MLYTHSLSILEICGWSNDDDERWLRWINRKTLLLHTHWNNWAYTMTKTHTHKLSLHVRGSSPWHGHKQNNKELSDLPSTSTTFPPNTNGYIANPLLQYTLTSFTLAAAAAAWPNTQPNFYLFKYMWIATATKPFIHGFTSRINVPRISITEAIFLRKISGTLSTSFHSTLVSLPHLISFPKSFLAIVCDSPFLILISIFPFCTSQPTPIFITSSILI